MKSFDGFPARMEFTPVPNPFLGALLAELADIVELKVTLRFFAMSYKKRGYPRFVTYRELMSDVALLASLPNGNAPEAALREALAGAVKRGTLLRLTVTKDGTNEDLYFLNDPAGKQAVARIQGGELALGDFKITAPVPAPPAETPDIFRFYEENVGLLTPLIADELREAEQTYPLPWLTDAIKEAVARNKRNWKYISRILERWSVEGKTDGAYQGDSQPKADPDKYVRGKYGHIVQR